MSPSAFIDELSVKLLPDSRRELLASLRFWSSRIGMIEIPAGFSTDFASVPRLPIVFWLTGDSAHEASVVHDWLYRTQEFPRRTADAVFLDAMSVSVPPVVRWRRWAMWAGVRLLGWIAWRENRRARART